MTLVDQMRTCAAAITASQASGNLDMKLMSGDAVRLLTEAAEIIAKSEIDLLDVQQDPLGAVLVAERHRHFDDGSKRRNARGNDPQALKSIGRLK